MPRFDSLRWSAANRYLLSLSLISLTILLVDQVTKQVALTYLVDGRPVSVLGSFLQLTLVFNEGGAFSTQIGSTSFYTFASIVVTVLILYVLCRDAGKNRLLDIALAMVVGGALGNLVDRLHYGRVIDWIDFDFFDISIAAGRFLFFELPGYSMTRWPVFNIADSAVSVGMVLIVIAMILDSRRQRCDTDRARS